MSTTETKVRHTPKVIEQLRMSNCNSEVEQTVADILEALEAAMRTLETIHVEDDISIDADVLAAGRAAIAKAKGGAA